jgi:hypothetical protein
MARKPDELMLLRQRARQFLVHSFLYYRLNESVVPDEDFDRIAADLRRLREKHPQAELPFAELIDPALGAEGSGFQIRRYPPETVTAAFKLLYAQQSPDEDFREFVERRGYRAKEAEG